MEWRLVLNNRAHTDVTDNELKGILHELLKYFKFRRLPLKNGRTIVYLFFRKEEETYCAVRAAKSMKNISLVRYRPTSPICLEPVFRLFPPQSMIDLVRYAFRNRVTWLINVIQEPEWILKRCRTWSFSSRNFSRFSCNVFQSNWWCSDFLQSMFSDFVLSRWHGCKNPLAFSVQERMDKLNHWWSRNDQFTISDNYGIQKLMDTFLSWTLSKHMGYRLALMHAVILLTVCWLNEI